jgi:hypothetical protein
MGIQRTKISKATDIKDLRKEKEVPEPKQWNHNPCFVGYWHETGDKDNKWPLKPILDKKRKNILVLKRLDALEKKARKRVFKGVSHCRICDKANGCSEYSETIDGIKYVWPEGLRHYLSKHKMIPSGGLYRMLKLRPKGGPSMKAKK